jgi:hypothetical protein
MRKHVLTAAAMGGFLLLMAVAPTGAAEVEEGFTPIFNGRDMTGWEGKPGWWFVQDGALTAKSTPEKLCKKHNYLMWRGGSASDFELRLEFRIVGGNSGIQFRSREMPDFDIVGYQADMEAGEQWTGCLFEVGGGRQGVAMRGEKVVIDEDGTKHVENVADPAELGRFVKKEDWNSYDIVAQGNEITLSINGRVMTQVTDNDRNKVKPGGMIAFQMHPGPPMTVQFRNIRIKHLK